MFAFVAFNGHVHRVFNNSIENKFEKAQHINTFLIEIQNKKHAKLQNFMQIGCKILILPPLILY